MRAIGRWLFLVAAGFAPPGAHAQISQRDFDLLAIETACVEASQKRVESEIKAKGAWKSGRTTGPFAKFDLCAEVIRGVVITPSGTIRVDARLAVQGQEVSDSKGVKRREATVDLVPRLMPGGSVAWTRK